MFMRTRTQAKPLAERFNNPALNEAMRIYPFTLRVTHYSRAHPSWPGRPKIHFEGEMLQDNATLTAIAPDGVTRRLRGTVQMAASGDVHWSLVRCIIISFSPFFPSWR